MGQPHLQFQEPRWYIPQVLTPAPGAEVDITPVGQGFWRIWSIVFHLATSVVVANRIPSFVLTDGANVFWREQASAALAASLAADYTMYQGSQPGVGAGALVRIGFPEGGLYLRQGDHLKTITAGIDVADQWSAVAAMVQELPSGPFFRMDPTDGVYSEFEG